MTEHNPTKTELRPYADAWLKRFGAKQERWSPSGIACPECGKGKHELLIDTTVSLTTNPPMSPVACPKCGFRGAV